MDILKMIEDIMLHMRVLNDDYTKLSIDVAVLKEQMKMIGWFVKLITAGIAGLILERAFSIFMKIRNGKR